MLSSKYGIAFTANFLNQVTKYNREMINKKSLKIKSITGIVSGAYLWGWDSPSITWWCRNGSRVTHQSHPSSCGGLGR
jgi:hypothetical protein